MEYLTVPEYAEQYKVSVSALSKRVTYSAITPVTNRKPRRYLKKDLDAVLTGYKHKARLNKPYQAPVKPTIDKDKLLAIRLVTHGFRRDHDLTKYCGYRNEAEFNRVCKILKGFSNGAYDAKN